MVTPKPLPLDYAADRPARKQAAFFAVFGAKNFAADSSAAAAAIHALVTIAVSLTSGPNAPHVAP